MERPLDLPHDVDALRTLTLAHQRTIFSLREEVARLEQQNRVLAKWVFGRSSEKRVAEPVPAALQGHLFLAEIASEAERLAEELHVTAAVSVEVPAHTRKVAKRRREEQLVRVCVGAATELAAVVGQHGSDLDATPVEATTWGRIKALYR